MQLSERLRLKEVMAMIDAIETHDSIQLGSAVMTDAMNYYVSIPLGKISIQKHEFFAISPVSPIGILLMGKKAGEHFSFNGKNAKINEVI